ncbi:MAG: hypothetical protein ACPG5U_04450 [Planktomarina sp.]
MPLQPLSRKQCPAPTHAAGLTHLSNFLPNAGRDYAPQRDFDRALHGHPDVSCLSPVIRHRFVTEAEVLQATLGRFSLTSAEKFVQEVF